MPFRQDLGVDFFAVVVVAGQGGVDVGQGELGVFGDDLARGLLPELVPDHDILDPDAAPGDPRLAAARARGADDVLAGD